MGIETWVFILGAPRSGTTWTQLLLSQHPDVATCPETHLVDGYLAPLHERVRWERERDMTGLTSVLPEDQLLDLLAGFAASVLETVSSRADAGVSIFLEKTPQNALHPELLLEHFPDARFLHVIRDPRDVAASMLAASRSWGAEWAPSGPVSAARLWREHVRGVRRLEDAGGYRELRFESLKEDPEAALAGIHEWLGLRSDPESRRQTVEDCELENLRQAPEKFEALPEKVHRNASKFFRKGESGGRTLSPSARRAVEHVASDEMRQLGYEPSGKEWPRGSVRALAYRILRRGGDALEYRVSALAERL